MHDFLSLPQPWLLCKCAIRQTNFNLFLHAVVQTFGNVTLSRNENGTVSAGFPGGSALDVTAENFILSMTFTGSPELEGYSKGLLGIVFKYRQWNLTQCPVRFANAHTPGTGENLPEQCLTLAQGSIMPFEVIGDYSRTE